MNTAAAPTLNITVTTPAENSLHDRFAAYLAALNDARKPSLDEMIEVVDRIGWRMHGSQRALVAACAIGDFDPASSREVLILRALGDFLGLIAQHQDEVKAVLQGRVPTKQPYRRRA